MKKRRESIPATRTLDPKYVRSSQASRKGSVSLSQRREPVAVFDDFDEDFDANYEDYDDYDNEEGSVNTLTMRDIAEIEAAIVHIDGYRLLGQAVGWVSPLRTGKSPRRPAQRTHMESGVGESVSTHTATERVASEDALGLERLVAHSDTHTQSRTQTHAERHTLSRDAQFTHTRTQSLTQSHTQPHTNAVSVPQSHAVSGTSSRSVSPTQTRTHTHRPLRDVTAHHLNTTRASLDEQRAHTHKPPAVDPYEALYDESVAEISRSLSGMGVNAKSNDNNKNIALKDRSSTVPSSSLFFSDSEQHTQHTPRVRFSLGENTHSFSISGEREVDIDLNKMRASASFSVSSLASQLSPVLCDRLRAAEEQLEVQLARERNASLAKLQQMLLVGKQAHLDELRRSLSLQWEQSERSAFCELVSREILNEAASLCGETLSSSAAHSLAASGNQSALSSAQRASIHLALKRMKDRAVRELNDELRAVTAELAKQAALRVEQQKELEEEERSARMVVDNFRLLLRQLSTTQPSNASADPLTAAMLHQQKLYEELTKELNTLKNSMS